MPIWNIIDARWELQLHRPLHAAAYYLNPHYHYNPNFKVNANIKIGLYQCLERMVPNTSEFWFCEKKVYILLIYISNVVIY